MHQTRRRHLSPEDGAEEGENTFSRPTTPLEGKNISNPAVAGKTTPLYLSATVEVLQGHEFRVVVPLPPSISSTD